MQYLIKPWDHQQKAIDMATAPGVTGFGFLMDMGTGKTCASINTLRHHCLQVKRLLRTLVICPVIVLENWHDEIKLHSKMGEYVTILHGPIKKRIALIDAAVESGTPKIFITNWEAISNGHLVDALLRYNPEVVIGDELHRIKNIKSKRTKAAIRIGDRSHYRMGLTGTGILNSPMDIFAQWRFLDKGREFGENFFSFRARYFYDKNAGMPKQSYFPDWQPLPDTMDILNRKIYKTAVRVMKSECMDLPPLVKKRVYVELGKEQGRVYKEMEKNFISFINDKACKADLAITKSLRLQQIISGHVKLDDPEAVNAARKTLASVEDANVYHFPEVPRMNALKEIVENIPETEKVIVWCCFRENYKVIEKMLTDMGVSCALIVGGMKQADRRKVVEDFQDRNSSLRCIVANQGAGGIGINLTAASYSIYYSRNFNLEHELQSNDRNYRGGSEIHESITRVDIVAKGTLDEKILDALHSKKTIAEAILEWRKS